MNNSPLTAAKEEAYAVYTATQRLPHFQLPWWFRPGMKDAAELHKSGKTSEAVDRINRLARDLRDSLNNYFRSEVRRLPQVARSMAEVILDSDIMDRIYSEILIHEEAMMVDQTTASSFESRIQAQLRLEKAIADGRAEYNRREAHRKERQHSPGVGREELRRREERAMEKLLRKNRQLEAQRPRREKEADDLLQLFR